MKVFLRQGVMLARMQLKHLQTVKLVGHWHEDPAFKSPECCEVQFPRHISSGENGNLLFNSSDLIHLTQKFSFDASLRLRFVASSSTAQRVHFVNQNN